MSLSSEDAGQLEKIAAALEHSDPRLAAELTAGWPVRSKCEHRRRLILGVLWFVALFLGTLGIALRVPPLLMIGWFLAAALFVWICVVGVGDST